MVSASSAPMAADTTIELKNATTSANSVRFTAQLDVYARMVTIKSMGYVLDVLSRLFITRSTRNVNVSQVLNLYLVIASLCAPKMSKELTEDAFASKVSTE